MSFQIEANRNSALFQTMQQVLEVYNPLVNLARPTVVNCAKQNFTVQPIRWGQTLSDWNGRQVLNFSIPRIGPLIDFNLNCVFKIPGVSPTNDDTIATMGFKGYAKTTLTTGGLDNTDTVTNTARGRLNRVYADDLLGLNMISEYTINSKSRQLFHGTREYLLVRYNRLDEQRKKIIRAATTPRSCVYFSSMEDTYYSPGVTYSMDIPLWMMFNEAISSALDVDFAEEVTISVTLCPPSELFYYGNIGDLRFNGSNAKVFPQYTDAAGVGQLGLVPWDQSTTIGSAGTLRGGNSKTLVSISAQQLNAGVTNSAYNGALSFGTASMGTTTGVADDSFDSGVSLGVYDLMLQGALGHIRGTNAPMAVWNEFDVNPSTTPWSVSTHTSFTGAYHTYGWTTSGPTFAYPDVDNNGDSIRFQAVGNALYLTQDTDAARALRAQQFPENSGLTTIVYNTGQEHFANLMTGTRTNPSTTILSKAGGGSIEDPRQSAAGIIKGSTVYVDLILRGSQLISALSFMVRKNSDLGGDHNSNASKTSPIIGRGVLAANKKVGAHRIYTRCLPIHYFEILVAGSCIYGAPAENHLALNQSAMYNGNGSFTNASGQAMMVNLARSSTKIEQDTDAARPFNIYTINFGLLPSLLQNSGCLSLQNLNQPTLRLYLRPDDYAEFDRAKNAEEVSDAMVAAALGIDVQVIYEHFNVLTINSGNGEITTGMNQ